MNCQIFTPCDLPQKGVLSAETYTLAFQEQGLWFRDGIFTTAEEAVLRREELRAIKQKFGLPIPTMEIVKAVFDVLP